MSGVNYEVGCPMSRFFKCFALVLIAVSSTYTAHASVRLDPPRILLSCTFPATSLTPLSAIEIQDAGSADQMVIFKIEPNGTSTTELAKKSLLTEGKIPLAVDDSNEPWVYHTFVEKSGAGWRLNRYFFCDGYYFEEHGCFDTFDLVASIEIQCVAR